MIRPTDLGSAMAAITLRVEAAMHADLAEALTGCDPHLIEVLHYILFSGGKRIRPLLTVLCSRSCGRDEEALYLLGAAFEYLHVATLVHDDVIDHARQRRGRDTVNTRFGMAAAILAGDWLHARSMYLIGKLVGAEGLEIFCRATASMANGEFEQIRLINDTNTEEEAYFRVIRQKTGNLIASTCAVGALFAGAKPAHQQALAKYGDKIGAAFQVVDDLLDFLGDERRTGKSIGNDFVEGKMTLPLLRALSAAEVEDRQVLVDLIHGDRSDPSAYRALLALIKKLGGFDSAAETARQLVDEAIHALALFSVMDSAAEHIALLKSLAQYILARNK